MAKGRAVSIALNDAEKAALIGLIRKHGAPQSVAVRARIVLAAASELTNKEIATKLDVCAHTVGVWRARFASDRMDGLYDSRVPAHRDRSVTRTSFPQVYSFQWLVPYYSKIGAIMLFSFNLF